MRFNSFLAIWIMAMVFGMFCIESTKSSRVENRLARKRCRRHKIISAILPESVTPAIHDEGAYYNLNM
jgi:hypothetical protein